MATIGSAEVLVAVCTLIGPILAVQAQKAVERASKRSERQKKIFEALMSTFATRIADEHVQALNLIELAFRPPGRLKKLFYFSARKDERVLEAWRTYAVNLFAERRDMNESQLIAHVREGDRLFKDLMFLMSDRLDYGLTKDVLAKGTYHPLGTVHREEALLKLLDGAAKIFNNESNIGMEVKSFPISNEAVDLQVKAYTAFLQLVEAGRVQIFHAKDPKQ